MLTRDEIKDVLRDTIDSGMLVDDLIDAGYEVSDEADGDTVLEMYEDALDTLTAMYCEAQKKSVDNAE